MCAQGILLALVFLSTCLQVAFLAAFNKSVPSTAPGPYFIVFGACWRGFRPCGLAGGLKGRHAPAGLLPFFLRDVPVVHRFRVLLLPFSDKIVVYILSLQVAASIDSPSPAMCR